MKWLTPSAATLDGSFTYKFVGLILAKTLTYYASNENEFEEALMIEIFEIHTITKCC